MRAATIPLLSTLAVLIVVGAWQVQDLRDQRAECLRDHRRHGTALLAAAEGIATREVRGGRYDPESLEATLSETLETFELEWLALATTGGVELGSAGQLRDAVDSLFRFEDDFEPLRPRRAGGRPPWAGGGWIELPADGPLTISLITSPEELEQRLATRFARFLVTTGSLTLAILLFGGVFWMRTRSLQLRAALETERREVESLDILRRLGAGLVHETKNPLGVVRGFAERITRTALEPEQLAEAARAIVEETDRTVARLDEFLLFSRPAELRRTRVAVRPLFEELALLLEPDLEAAGATLAIECGDCEIDADLDQLRRLFMNLVLNAIQAVEPGGRITLICREEAGRRLLIVEDDGCGVPEELRETLFEPYVSMRVGGTGLGLSIASRIAIDHGFVLRHEPHESRESGESPEPRGTRLILEVPTL